MTCCCNVLTGKALYVPVAVYTGADITDLVELAGGNVNAELRFSMKWDSWSDVDFHLATPNGEIYYSSKRHATGELDVDMNVGSRVEVTNSRTHSKPAVENISFPNFNDVPDGTYLLGYKQYSVYGGREHKSDVPTILVTRRYGVDGQDGLSSDYLVIDFPDRENGNQPEKFHVARFSKQGELFTLEALADGAVITSLTGSKITVPDNLPRISERW